MPSGFGSSRAAETAWRGDLATTRGYIPTILNAMEKRLAVGADGKLAPLTVHSSKVRLFFFFFFDAIPRPSTGSPLVAVYCRTMMAVPYCPSVACLDAGRGKPFLTNSCHVCLQRGFWFVGFVGCSSACVHSQLHTTNGNGKLKSAYMTDTLLARSPALHGQSRASCRHNDCSSKFPLRSMLLMLPAVG